MSNVTVDVPEKTAIALNVSPEQLGSELRLAAAMKLYEMGRLSSGAAAELAGVPKPVFLAQLSEYGVPTFRVSEDELAQETRLG